MECVYFVLGFISGIIIILIILKLIKNDTNNIESTFNRVLNNYNKHFLFSNNQNAGVFGEYILENILSSAGLKKDREYFIQKQFDDKRPDVVIKLDDSRCVFIDSKTNLKHYKEYLDANDTKNKEKKLKQLKAAIKLQINNLSVNEYHKIQNVDDTCGFTLMFIPVESMYELIFDNDNELFDFAINKNIIIVSPVSLICILKIIKSFNLKLKQNENISEIVSISSNLGNEFYTLINEVKKIGNICNKIRNNVYGSSNIHSQIEKLRDYGVEIKNN